MSEKIKQITQTNQAILFEFYGRMKGVIRNKWHKSQGFQFALLEKNLNELSESMCQNNKLIKKHLQEKPQQKHQ